MSKLAQPPFSHVTVGVLLLPTMIGSNANAAMATTADRGAFGRGPRINGGGQCHATFGTRLLFSLSHTTRPTPRLRVFYGNALIYHLTLSRLHSPNVSPRWGMPCGGNSSVVAHKYSCPKRPSHSRSSSRDLFSLHERIKGAFEMVFTCS